MKKLLLGFVLIVFFLNSFSQITQWRGPNRDGHFPDSILLQSWPEAGPELLLEIDKIGKGYSSALIDDGIIYTTGMIDTLDYLTAINLDGTFKWQKIYGRSWYKSFPDTRSTAVIEENRIYVQSGMGQVSCFNKETGDEIWSVNVDKEFETEYHRWGNSETPLVIDNLVIVSPAGEKTSIVALNKMTGEKIWQTKSLGGPRAYASATIYEYRDIRYILAVIGTDLIAIVPETGEIAWHYKYWNEKKWDQNGLIWANTPTFKDNEIFLTMGYDYQAVMLEMDSIGSGVTEKFIDHTFDNHHHGVILYDGYLYGSNWYNNKKGRWVCMKWDTGEIKYVEEWETKGAIIMADNLFYCYNEKGSVGLIKPNPDGFEVISEFKVTKGAGPHWAHPFIGEGKLLIRHGDVLMVYDIAEK
ncbi:PQQ-binding-like beta-propeller repeat protein [Draconibacterium sp.]|nr:PQQ-binding-like beta-propeller repeat protein [Draconibacterium sp.]